MNAERIFSALLALAAIALMIPARHYTAKIAYDPLGPRPYPMLILGLLAVCALGIALKPHKNAVQLYYPKGMLSKVCACIAVMLIYALVFELIGFMPAAALMVFALGKLFGGRTIACLITAAVLAVGLYLLFDVLLDVTLPMGKLF